MLVVVPAAAGGSSVLATTTGPGCGCCSLDQTLSHFIQFREWAAGVTRTEVRNERSSSSVTPRTNWPLYAWEIAPVSSDTATTTASVSSLKPSAARWRVPTD